MSKEVVSVKSAARPGAPWVMCGVLAFAAPACSSSPPDAAVHFDAGPTPDASPPDATPNCTPMPRVDNPTATCSATASSNIQHLVVLVQENHTFDNYFGKYCTATTGSNPTCNTGPACCEKAPATDPGTGMAPVVLDDTTNAAYDNNHSQDCELEEINGGAMDKFISAATSCGDARNFAYADLTGPIAPYITMAQTGAIADHFFQPVAGQSSSNDMYLAEARFVFKDNDEGTASIGSTCGFGGSNHTTLTEPNIGDLLNQCSVTWGWYIEGYGEMKVDRAMTPPICPSATAACGVNFNAWPCIYDPTDIPFQYYSSTRDKANMKDFSLLAGDIAAGNLPAVTFVKAIGYKSEHPGFGNTLTSGLTAVQEVVRDIQGNATLAQSTLIVILWDEGGGYFDHVLPPVTSPVDCAPYGTRVPMIAIGRFAKTNYVSHAVMEHSSIVKFIEWNWLSARTGQLGNRDKVVNNLGDLLDSSMTGTTVPAN